MAARWFGRCRSAAPHLRRRDGEPLRARTDGVASPQTRAAPRGRGCPERAAARPDALGSRRTCRGYPSLTQFPLPHDFEQLVIRQIDVEWGDRDVAVLQSLKVGVRTARPGHAPAADPMNFASPRDPHRRDLFVKDAAPQVRHLHALDLIAGNRWQVDVEQRLAREVFDLHDAPNQSFESRAMTLEVFEVKAPVRERDAGNAG